MFRRLLLEDSAAIFTIVAFVTAAAIFAYITWRALRLPRQRSDQLAHLPFNSDSAARHDAHS